MADLAIILAKKFFEFFEDGGSEVRIVGNHLPIYTKS